MERDRHSQDVAAGGSLAASGRRLSHVDDHDLGLIVERLAWTPAQRLDANTAFLRFYLSVRPGGPLLTGER